MGAQQLKLPLLDLENRMERHLSSPATLPQPCAHQTKMQSLDFRAQRCLIHILSSLYFSDVKSFRLLPFSLVGHRVPHAGIFLGSEGT